MLSGKGAETGLGIEKNYSGGVSEKRGRSFSKNG
jgi:hypothetical protein